MTISAKEHPKKTVRVLDHNMSYVEMGEGRPIVFQHGNPTSSYLWRNIMPPLARHGRCVAVDLIGMGDSDKLSPSGPDRYRFEEHRRFLHAAWDALGIADDIVFVIHDWGSALGFDYAAQYPDRVAGLVYMEAVVAPIAGWDGWPDEARNIFQAFRSEAGEELCLQKNFFVEGVLPSAVMRKLTAEEMAVYRRPYESAGESRRPTLSWPREIPIGGEPANVAAIVQAYADAMAQSPLPKLFINAEPGSILRGEAREFCRRWPNQTEVTVKGSHFLQEDSPQEIADAIAAFLPTLDKK